MAISYKKSIVKGTNVRFINGLKQISLHHCFFLVWKLFPGALKAVLSYFFFRPPGYVLSKRQKQLMSKANSFYFTSEGRRLTAYEWGRGPAIVLLHGWGGCSLQFDRFIPELTAAGFSVLAFDQPAHGNSDGKTANYFEFSNAVSKFFDHLKDRRIVAMIGHSLGASAAVNYLWHSRNELETILISPALYLSQMLEAAFVRYGVPKPVFRTLISDLEARTGHSIEKENPVDLLRQIHREILVVHDTKDTAVPYCDSWNAGLGQSNIRLFPTTGLGHYRILQDHSLVAYLTERLEHKVKKALPCTQMDSGRAMKDGGNG